MEKSVTVNNNSPIQDYVHPDDQIQPTIMLLFFFSKLFARRNRGFSFNSLVNKLTVTLTVNEIFIGDFLSIFQKGLSVNMSVTTLSLTIKEYGESHIPLV